VTRSKLDADVDHLDPDLVRRVHGTAHRCEERLRGGLDDRGLHVQHEQRGPGNLGAHGVIVTLLRPARRPSRDGLATLAITHSRAGCGVARRSKRSRHRCRRAACPLPLSDRSSRACTPARTTAFIARRSRTSRAPWRRPRNGPTTRSRRRSSAPRRTARRCDGSSPSWANARSRLRWRASGAVEISRRVGEAPGPRLPARAGLRRR
jgi:hypothetical protein